MLSLLGFVTAACSSIGVVCGLVASRNLLAGIAINILTAICQLIIWFVKFCVILTVMYGCSKTMSHIARKAATEYSDDTD